LAIITEISYQIAWPMTTLPTWLRLWGSGSLVESK
jgi:hypothetical protein